MKASLIDYIYSKTDFLYLSDLRNIEDLRKYSGIIKSIKEDEFSLFDWKDMCEYITNNNNVNSVNDAKKLVLDALRVSAK